MQQRNNHWLVSGEHGPHQIILTSQEIETVAISWMVCPVAIAPA